MSGDHCYESVYSGSSRSLTRVTHNAAALKHFALSAAVLTAEAEELVCELAERLKSIRLCSVHGSVGKLLLTVMRSQSIELAFFNHLSVRVRDISPGGSAASSLKMLSMRRVSVVGLWRQSDSPLPAFPKLEVLSVVGCNNILNWWLARALATMHELRDFVMLGASHEVQEYTGLFTPAIGRLERSRLAFK